MRKLLLVLFFCLYANADVFQNQQVYAAANVINSFGCEANKTISEKYIKNAKAVVVLTDVVKSGLIASVQSGNGIFSMKDENGDWTSPIMVRYRGFGAGLQAGYQSTDIVMLFQTSKSFRDLFNGQDTLELNAGVSFVEGKSAGVATDLPEVSAWMVRPGEVTGIYIGASIDFGRLTIDDQATNDYYDRIFTYDDILNGSPKDSKYTRVLKSSLSKNLGKERIYGTCNIK
ncbi:putative lipid-binding protein (SYLF/DUF500 domain) [Campylobacter blaseri]|uniref:Ysc84 actin-binding domain-containing protein n=1 Tax=Campylobacter blaseri TaxID=2042961 RepID=A0A2P8R285_9BACT|nr:lipid-binding SYLF domain-containing protein [Campylobacter blaseri]PSM52616.1 hypothetical protein CQ405_02485 [Campylobacter blaseri]PSM54264.1 hypothetical protein CRN67_02485 [Campylobacter blaseri]QKF85915.1 putative lipid-binding protein (SYLF/DUF500 domain) [Campylobacter blaseri]